MKLKRLMTASMAAVMAVSSAIVCQISVSAAETVLYEYKAGQITEVLFTEEAMTAVKAATKSIEVTIDAEGDGSFFLLETSTWKGSGGSITSSDENWAAFTAANGIKVCPSNYTKVNKITAIIDGTASYTVYDVTAETKGIPFPKTGDIYKISADDLANAGVTAENIADSKLVVTFDSVGENKELSLLATREGWGDMFYWGNSMTAGEMELPLTGFCDSVDLGTKPLTTGISLFCKDSVVSKIAIRTPAKHVESLKITQKDGSNVDPEYTYGETIALTAVVTPDDADDADKVTWASETPDVATVNENGEVTLLKAGEAKITATADGKSASVTFTVKKKKLTVAPSALTEIYVKDNKIEAAAKAVTAKYALENDENVSLVKGTDYTVSEPQISADKKYYSITITLSDDAAGKYELSTTTLKGYIAYELTSVALNSATLNLVAGADGRQLVATTTPDNALLDNLTFTYKSDNETVATVDKNGLVTPLKAGTATITVTAKAVVTTTNGMPILTKTATAKCTVTVTDNTIPATNIELDASSKTMTVGEKAKLTATVKPDDSTDKVTWKSNNDKIVSVDENGNITALAVGETEVIATAGSVSAVCKVTVEGVKVSEVKLDKTSVSLKAGETAQLTATVTPDNATDKTVTWTSSNEKIATVADGKITAVAPGTATITATSGDKSATCTVTVAKEAQIIKDPKKYPGVPKDYAKVDPVVTTENDDGTKNMLVMFSISDSDVKNFRGARVTFKRADGKTFSRSLILGKYYTDVTYVKDGDNYNGNSQNYIVIRLKNVDDSWGDISAKFELINGLG